LGGRVSDNVLYTSRLGYGQVTADLSGKLISYFGVTRHRLYCAGLRIGPQRMLSPFSFQKAAVFAQMLQ
jgi:hypothetical protein